MIEDDTAERMKLKGKQVSILENYVLKRNRREKRL